MTEIASTLIDGPACKLELLRAKPRKAVAGRRPLLFLHGAFAAAWAWEDRFLPYFALQGWDAYALSLRGHGGSEGHDNLNWWGLEDYCLDLQAAIDQFEQKPVVIGHSMGGLIAQEIATRRTLPGLVLLASVPPDGVGSTATHIFFGSPALVWSIGMAQIFGPQAVSAEGMQEYFFSSDVSDEEAGRIMSRVQKESQRVIGFDMLHPGLDPSRSKTARVLVIGGEKDAFVSAAAMRRTAEAWKADLILRPDLPHAMIMDPPTWQGVADSIIEWLEDGTASG